MAAAVPFAIKAGAMIGGSLLGKKLSGPSKQQNTAMQGAQNAAGQVGQYASPLVQSGLSTIGQGRGYLQGAGNYYGNILSNRRSAREALAPEMKNVMDYYAGATSKANRTLRGGARDYATAELDKQRVGNLAMMLPQARATAAEGLGNLAGSAIYGGSNLVGTGVGAAGKAADIYSGLFNNATTVRNQEGEGGKAWGGLLYDLAGSLFGGKKGGGGGTASMIPGTGIPVFSGTQGGFF
jgi:hypothetical protein